MVHGGKRFRSIPRVEKLVERFFSWHVFKIFWLTRVANHWYSKFSFLFREELLFEKRIGYVTDLNGL